MDPCFGFYLRGPSVVEDFSDAICRLTCRERHLFCVQTEARGGHHEIIIVTTSTPRESSFSPWTCRGLTSCCEKKKKTKTRWKDEGQDEILWL